MISKMLKKAMLFFVAAYKKTIVKASGTCHHLEHLKNKERNRKRRDCDGYLHMKSFSASCALSSFISLMVKTIHTNHTRLQSVSC